VIYTDAIFVFLLFAVWASCAALRRFPAQREWLIITVSLLVIGSWGAYDLLLFLGVLVFNYCVAFPLESQPRPKAKRILVAAVAFNLCVLAVFKYANFASSAASSLFGLSLPRFPLGIPLAISFYTFHVISYLVDVYKGRARRLEFRAFLFYLSFFPHVVAGPIVRVWQLAPQIGKVRRVRADWPMGLHLFVVGIFLKAVIANNIAQSIDPFWEADRAQVSGPLEHWIVAFLDYCQIYADFAGYTLIALGMARMMNYRLPGNFRGPMLASSLQDFWRRWHITLSRWLRDYLYIPLGGNRDGYWRGLLNLMITMLLGGLWHGAGWGFIIWGGMQGLGLVAERIFSRFFSSGSTASWPGTVAGLILTQAWVTLAWVFFRSSSGADGLRFLHQMFASSEQHHGSINRALWLPLVLSLAVIVHNSSPLWIRKIPRRNVPAFVGMVTAVLMVADLVIFSPAKVFIYFRF
jgi:alginate O-acetyltransferase complex protein AlgI